MNIPDWVADAIFYQIFPDRFANGDTENDPVNVQPWGVNPTIRGFQGGDLRGIIQGLEYLSELGINSLYLNPIFQATTNHRYNTTDYFQIDPKLGTLDDFKTLLEEAHQANIRILLDGVFNHTGRGFFAFNDILENEAESAYLDWYHIQRLPLNAYTADSPANYLAWWGLKELPKLNTDNPAVRKYIMDVARYWIDLGIDGWRLDVPNEIDDDRFWAEFRAIVKGANPDAYLVGEIWEMDPRWVDDDHFDGVINYPFRDLVLDLLVRAEVCGRDYSRRLDDILRAYPEGSAIGQYNVIGSHDTVRLRTLCEGSLEKVRLAFILQFCHAGAPAIYYGDEIGLEGQKDPDNRRAFPWAEDQWSHQLHALIRRLTTLRTQHVSLRRGNVVQVEVGDPAAVVFLRRHAEEHALLLVNPTCSPIEVQTDCERLVWPEGVYIDVLQGREIRISPDGINITLEGLDAVLIFTTE